MAAIIAQLSNANRARQRRKHRHYPPDKSLYEIPPFDVRFEPELHNKYLRCKRILHEKEQLEKLHFIHEVSTKSKDILDDRFELLHQNVIKVRRKRAMGKKLSFASDSGSMDLVIAVAALVFLTFFVLLFVGLAYTFHVALGP